VSGTISEVEAPEVGMKHPTSKVSAELITPNVIASASNHSLKNIIALFRSKESIQGGLIYE